MKSLDGCGDKDSGFFKTYFEKMKINLFFIYFSVFLVISCKKTLTTNTSQKNIETIFPNNYYPVYPKSWWKYKINDSLIITSSVSDTFKLNSYRISYHQTDVTPEYSNLVYVPFLDNNPIYGYNKIEYLTPSFGDYFMKWPILSETVGFKFERNWEDKRYGDFSEYVEVKSKKFNGKDSILLLEGHWVYGPNISHKSFQEYTKGKGLTKEFIVDTLKSDTLYKKILIDYFINK